MIDERERFERAFEQFTMPERSFDRLLRRRDRKRRNQRIAAGVVGLAVFVSFALAIGIAMRSQPKPAAPIPVVPPNKPAHFSGRITYRSGSKIMTVDPANPQHAVALEPSHGLDPIGWSPDGTELLLSGTNQGGYTNTLSVVHADGLTTRLPRGDWGSFSPDGTKIAYAVGGGVYLNIVDPKVGGVYVVDAKGGTPHLIDEEKSPSPCGQAAAWSPDGSRIAFIDFESLGGAWCPWFSWSLSFVNADGSGLQEDIRDIPWGAAGGIAWSPDGSQLVLSMTGFEGHSRGIGGRIYIVKSDGTGLRQISSGVNDRWPAWSPDGERIAFVRGHQLFTMASDGSDVQAVEGVHPDGPIAWNPIG